MINILPEFESRQVLTSDELNWLACYLDAQARQSRRFLIGCGVVGGLQVKLVNNSVQVSNGIGLTSAGHLVSVSGEGGMVSFTRAKKYAPKANEKLAFHYLTDMDSLEENYSKSADETSIYFTSFTGDVLELFEETSNEADPFDGATMKGKVALVFAEILQKELKDCEGENCQERGKKYVYNTKVLVISKEDALLLLSKEYGTANETGISQLAFPWLHLPNLTILKPVFSNPVTTEPFDEKRFIKEYTRCILDFRSTLTAIQQPFEIALKNLQNFCTEFTNDFAVVDKLIAAVNNTGVMNNQNQTPFALALVYDFLWCFTKAYQELQAEAQRLRAKCSTGEADFPNHVFLGLLTDQNADFTDAVSAGYSIYRHSFQSRFAQAEQTEVRKRVSLYLNRLRQIAEGFQAAALSTKREIRITSGGNLYYPLSKQSIPFYLSQTVAGSWSPWSANSNLNRYITAYGNVDENQAASSQLPYNNQPTAFQGDHSFFRVEGVYGQTAISALNTVFQLRKKHGLAFEVLMLRMNEKAPFSNSFNLSINEDIESMYQVVRAEILKQISLCTTYFQSLFLKSDQVAEIQTALSNALEKSFLLFLNNINATILTQPINVVLADAITASNITTSTKPETVSSGVKFKELESTVAKTTTVAAKTFRTQAVGTKTTQISAGTFELLRPLIFVDLGLLFFNTLGTLVNNIKSSDKFKATSDISFYSHLLVVAKNMLKTKGTAQLFLLSLRLYCTLKLQEAYLDENFLELDVDNYQNNLEDELIPAADALLDYLPKATADPVKDDEYLLEVKKGEIQGYAERINFDDDWVKIIQLDAENKKRNGGLGAENLLERFIGLHPGIAHGCGVPKGGTYIMVYDAANQITADFYLPYTVSTYLRPIQYTLLENKSLTLSGTVKDSNGKAVPTTLLVGTATILTDSEGFFNALVNENTTVKVVCKTAGFEDFSQDVEIKDQSQTLNITLRPVAVKKVTTTVRFMNAAGVQLNMDIALITLPDNSPLIAKAGSLPVNDEPGKTFQFRVQDQNFAAKDFSITLGDEDKGESVVLTQVDQIRIQIVGRPNFVPTLLSNVQIVDPPSLQLDKTRAGQGRFVTVDKLDVTTSATVEVSYAGQTTRQSVKPGKDDNQVPVDTPILNRPVDVKVIVGLKPNTNNRINILVNNRLAANTVISINNTPVTINANSHIGTTAISTTGQITLTLPGTTLQPFDIQNFPNISRGVVFIDLSVFKETITNRSFTQFTKALNTDHIAILASMGTELATIARSLSAGDPTFFLMLLSDTDVQTITRIVRS